MQWRCKNRQKYILQVILAITTKSNSVCPGNFAISIGLEDPLCNLELEEKAAISTERCHLQAEQVRLHTRTEDMLRLEKAAQLMRQNFHKVKMKVKANQRQNDTNLRCQLRRTCQKSLSSANFCGRLTFYTHCM